ncbi:hypothetical protein [Insolitispirillum peregrinum]|uniref:DUF4064 domain-containing protein n=1 Tax=Insolitispirillum peregrinum TaxID=80876 RepID=A0A1N7MFK2_9PROT|nr:hypothetical protein [Insolitispirillum peregrinum]SIS84739.1 hypothetical protein SAMN05421779_10486 [Insolitispirillum peregrinum]
MKNKTSSAALLIAAISASAALAFIPGFFAWQEEHRARLQVAELIDIEARNNFLFFCYMLSSCIFLLIAFITIMIACHYRYTPFNKSAIKRLLFMIVISITSTLMGVYLAWHGADVWVNP